MVPNRFRDSFFSVGILLSSYRALSDAKHGYQRLTQQQDSGNIAFSEWHVQWIGICALLRASVHLFQSDSKACLNNSIKDELAQEWRNIKENSGDHKIYWKFINKERNAVLKEYHWTAYEAYFDELGEEIPTSKVGVFLMADPKIEKKLKINSGDYEGTNALDVLGEAIDWVEDRIAEALSRAGFQVDDKVHFLTWQKMPEVKRNISSGTLLTLLDSNEIED